MFVIFLIFAQNIDCGYTLQPPRRGGSKGYQQSMFWSKNKKNRYTPAYPSFTKLGQVSRKFAAAKNGQVSSKFAAEKNGQVSSKIAAAKNGQVSSKFAASRKIETKMSTNSFVLVRLSSL